MFAVVFQTCACNPHLSLKLYVYVSTVLLDNIIWASQKHVKQPIQNHSLPLYELHEVFPSSRKSTRKQVIRLHSSLPAIALQECPTTFRESHSMALHDLTPPCLFSHLASLPSNCVLPAPRITFSPLTDHLPTGPLFVLVQLLRISSPSPTLYLNFFSCFS